MPSSPMLLHIYCLCFSNSCTVIPTSFNILMKMFLPLFHSFFVVYLLVKYNALCMCASPTPFAACGHMNARE